jgi:major membrane immunogen (membrane-anchored lipoprotein)
MADQKISQLPSGTLYPQTIFPIVTLGTTSQTTFANLANALSLVITGGTGTSTGTTITAMTFNQGTYDLTVDQNDGTSFTQNFGILATDMTVTGGTYDMMTGIVQFTNNSGGTFSVTGFAVGATDTVITNVSFDPTTKFLTIDDSAGNSFNTSINDFNGLNVIGSLSATTFYGDGSHLTGIPVGTGGTVTGAYLPLSGGTMESNADIIFANGSILSEGTIDAGTGGAKGLAQICSIGYELKWEAGRLYIMNQGGTQIREVKYQLFYNPSNTDDDTKGFYVGSRWVLDNGNVYVCTDATTGNAIWELKFTEANVSAMTFNQGTYDLTINQTDGTSFTQSLGVLATDMTVTGGTYDFNTGIVEFVNNSGGTFNVTGFASGLTDSTIANFTYNNANTFTITDTTGGTFNALFNTVTGLTVSGSLSATTFYGDGSNLTGIAGGASVFTVGSSGTLSIKANNPTTNAVGNYSFANNFTTTARGNYSVAQNESSYALGQGSHAEGRQTNAIGVASHAEGFRTYAGDKYFPVITATGKTLIVGPTNVDFSADFTPTGYLISDAYYTYQYTGYTYSAPNFTFGLTVTGFSGTRVVDSQFRTSLLTPFSSGQNSHAEGNSSKAIGSASHAEGAGSIAYGNNSHAEGNGTVASGLTSHAEGYGGFAIGNYSHAEGYYTQAKGSYSHAEGISSYANGTASHAEGSNNLASGEYSHAEGNMTKATMYNAHAEGQQTTASGWSSHAEGYYSIAGGDYSHAEGYNTRANRTSTHAEGYGAQALGNATHAEGYGSLAIADNSHAEGEVTKSGNYYLGIDSTVGNAIYISDDVDYSTTFSPFGGTAIIDGKRYNYSASSFSSPNFIVYLDDTVLSSPALISDLSNLVPYDWGNVAIFGQSSHAEGNSTIAIGDSSHAEGTLTIAGGNYSHAEGNGTQSVGTYSHAEGYQTEAFGMYSHAEGNYSVARGDGSHAEGNGTLASGTGSHAENNYTKAYGAASHAGGVLSIANGYMSFVHGNKSEANSTTTVVLGDNITGNTANTIYVSDLVIKKAAAVPTSSADAIGEIGSVTWDATNFYWKTAGGWLKVSGSTF